jgi:hypothetical protein
MTKESRRHHETIMEQRLRRSRGEEIDDSFAEPVDEEMFAPAHDRYPVGYYPEDLDDRLGCLRTVVAVVGSVAVLLFIWMQLTSMPGVQQWLGSTFPQFNLPTLFGAPPTTIRADTPAVIHRIQQLNRLETTSYTVEKVIEAGHEGNAFQDLLFGDRLLLVAHGQVIAGIDLSTLQANQIVVSEDGTVLTVHLPPAQIFHTALDNQKTRVYDREQGLFAPTDKDLETVARQAAESQILQAACEGGVLERATIDGQRAMEQILGMLDFQRVEVIPAPVPGCSLPANQ